MLITTNGFENTARESFQAADMSWISLRSSGSRPGPASQQQCASCPGSFSLKREMKGGVFSSRGGKETLIASEKLDSIYPVNHAALFELRTPLERSIASECITKEDSGVNTHTHTLTRRLYAPRTVDELLWISQRGTSFDAHRAECLPKRRQTPSAPPTPLSAPLCFFSEALTYATCERRRRRRRGL